jgi:hypothetical protein
MLHTMKPAIHCLLICAILLLAACESADEKQVDLSRQQMSNAILAEQPCDYFIGRRLYKKDYKFWGYIRSPGKPWSTAKLVMLNEQQKLAPDRAMDKIGSDNNYEYKLYGHFSNDPPGGVYEPASNNWYPEFVLTGYELISASPAPIFHTAAAVDPDQRVIGIPY